MNEPRASAPTALASGTRRAVTFGNYRLFARLGSGGMADVYLAIAHGAMDVNRLVVIKKLREGHANEPLTRGMFLDEARIAARLGHPNVVQTFEAGDDGGSYWLAMEYIDGQPLSRLLTALKRRGALLPPRLAARVCSDFLNGLHYAHELTDFDGSPLGIVHRDVSPQNVMVSCDGAVKLVDFGIAKAAGTRETEHGVFKGKVAFMAPEQVRAESVDRRADIFAAGIVLWESVTGKHLMAESTPAATLYNLLSKSIPRASEVNPEVPPALDDVIDRALQRVVEDRYPTAKAMRDDLEAFIVSAGGVQNEELGALVKELFAEPRERLQAQIRAQLTTLSLGRPSDGRVPSIHELGTEVRQTPTSASPTAHVGPAPTDASLVARLVTLDDGFTEASSSSASALRVVTGPGSAVGASGPARGVAVGLWFGVLLLALVAAAALVLRSQQPRGIEPAPPIAAPALTAPAVTQEATATPTMTATASATTPAPEPTATPRPTAAPAHVPRATPRQAWAPPARTEPRSASQPPSAAAASDPPTSAAQPAARPPDAPQGRTFRRDL